MTVIDLLKCIDLQNKMVIFLTDVTMSTKVLSFMKKLQKP